jgi:pimeloyl-ACP methyl ester carboxylesterase
MAIGTSKIWITSMAGLLLAASGFTAWRFDTERDRAERRLEGASRVMQSRFGDLEYAIAGDGPPLLMIHGTGGGFDQGLLFAEAVQARRHRIIAPSRFGYLRSTFPAEPSSEHQADAFVNLLDELGIDRIVVAGGSAGALSAAAFALRHPERCAGLVLLVPASNLDNADPVKMSDWQKALVERLAGSDLLYWSAGKLARPRLIGTLLATDPVLLERAATKERQRVDRIIDTMLPISRRTQGMLNDGRLAGAPVTFNYAEIRVPTLIVSVEDDRFGTAATARRLAQIIPGSRLVIYPSGGHVWIGHDADVAREIDSFMAGLPQGRPAA